MKKYSNTGVLKHIKGHSFIFIVCKFRGRINLFNKQTKKHIMSIIMSLLALNSDVLRSAFFLY